MLLWISNATLLPTNELLCTVEGVIHDVIHDVIQFAFNYNYECNVIMQ